MCTVTAHAQICGNPGVTGVTLIPPVNTYYPGTGASLNAGASSIPVGAIDTRGSTTPIAAGDVVLIIQMQGADISAQDNNRYGDGIGSGGTQSTATGDYAGVWPNSANYTAGSYEYMIATYTVTVLGDTLNFTSTTTRAHANATGGTNRRTFQAFRVPQVQWRPRPAKPKAIPKKAESSAERAVAGRAKPPFERAVKRLPYCNPTPKTSANLDVPGTGDELADDLCGDEENFEEGPAPQPPALSVDRHLPLVFAVSWRPQVAPLLEGLS